jgi:hypothetical protein
MSSNVNTNTTFAELCHVLMWHSKGKTCLETLNRLWRKNQAMWGMANVSPMQESSLRITRESWDLARLWSLLHPTQVTPKPPDSLEYELVVVRTRAKDYLIDGRRRINHWKRTLDDGPHSVLVVWHPSS